jgi:hypothetical protein
MGETVSNFSRWWTSLEVMIEHFTNSWKKKRRLSSYLPCDLHHKLQFPPSTIQLNLDQMIDQIISSYHSDIMIQIWYRLLSSLSRRNTKKHQNLQYRRYFDLQHGQLVESSQATSSDDNRLLYLLIWFIH